MQSFDLREESIVSQRVLYDTILVGAVKDFVCYRIQMTCITHSRHL